MKRLDLEGALYIVKEMFNFIGQEFNRDDVEHDPEWYMKHSWSEDQQLEFTKWLIEHLCTKYRQPKKRAEEGAKWFIFCYGFVTKPLDSSAIGFTTKQPEEKDATT